MKYAMTTQSSNRKTGAIPVSYSSAETCPDACPLKGNGCYAEHGPGAIHWRKVTEGSRGVPFAEFLEQVRRLPRNQLWRFNVAGDLPGVGDHLDPTLLLQLVAANRGRRGFTYTHKPMSSLTARISVQLANENGFTVNLSADNLHEADELKALDIAPVVVVLPTDAPDTLLTPGGNKVVACPAETRDVSCEQCRACAVPTRNGIIGFRAHGSGKNKVNIIVRST